MSRFNRPSGTTLEPLIPTWSTEFARAMTDGRRVRLPFDVRYSVQGKRALRYARLSERPFRVMHQRRRLQVCRHILFLWRLKPRTMAILREATQHVVWTGGRP